MAFEPIYEVSVAGGLQKLCSGQVVAEAKLVPPHGEEITKILGTSAMVDVVTTEVFTGEARIKGKVDFRVLYVGSSGENRCLDYRAEFSDKIESENITGGKPCISGKVLDTDIVSASSSEIKLAAVVEIELFGENSRRIKYLHKGGDGIYSNESRVPCTKVIAEISASTEVSAEAELNATSLECIESRICVEKSVSSSNMVIVEGEIVSDVVYVGEGGLSHIALVTPFTVEAEAEGATSGAITYASARINDVKANLIDGEVNTLLINYDVCVSGFVLEEKELVIVGDAFADRCKLNKSVEKAEFSVNKQFAYLREEADGSVTLQAEMPIVDSIVTPLGSSVLISSAYASDGKIAIEGLVRSNVIYYSGETSSYNSVTVELPFSVTKSFDVCEGDMVYAVGEVLKVNTKIRRGNEIELIAELGISVSISEIKQVDIITELSEGEEIVAPKCALSLHIASKKETLWDIARALCISPEEVMAQNPELSFPLGGGERVVCYRKLGN